MKIFSGYIVHSKRKKKFSLKDIDLAFQCGTLYFDKKDAQENLFKGEKISKITIELVKRK